MSRADVTMREVLLADMYEEQIDRLTAELEGAKALVCSTTLQRNEYFVRAEQAEKERDNWVESARMFCSNEEYYRGLCDKALNSIGDESYICDDGSRSEDPLRAKLPELVDKLVWNEALLIKERDRYRQALEKILGPMGHDYGLTQQIAREALSCSDGATTLDAGE